MEIAILLGTVIVVSILFHSWFLIKLLAVAMLIIYLAKIL